MILVLSPDSPPEMLTAVRETVERLGWTCEESRGDEQLVLALAGSGDSDALEDALAGFELDVIPLLSNRVYRRIRARRRVMTGLATGLGLLTAVGAGIPVVGFLLPPRGTLSDPDLIRAGATDKLEEGSARPILFHGVPVFLIRLAGDRFFALSAICTHMKVCRLEWDADRSLLLCPCHGGSFDVHGNVVRGPASTPLTSYAVDQVGDELFIRREG